MSINVDGRFKPRLRGRAVALCGLFFLFCLLLSGCRHHKPPGSEPVPAGVRDALGVYVDINPRWSHNGKRIAFLRSTPNRKLQLFVVDANLKRPFAQLEPELVCPDRPYSPSLRRYSSPDTLAWSPEDRSLAFVREEWFTFEDGERLPGTGIWSLDTFSGRVTPLALHPTRYKSLYYFYRYPQWSPDGRYVAFVGEGLNGQRSIFLRTLAGQQPKEVQPRFDNYDNSDWPTWETLPPPLSKGKRPQPGLIFRQGVLRSVQSPIETLRRMRPGTTEAGRVWRLTAPEYRSRCASPQTEEVPLSPRTGHFAFSPDGKQLAFTLTPDANAYERYELWTMNRDGTGARRVSAADGKGYFAPVWIDRQHLGALSPQGRRFAVVLLNTETHKTQTLGTLPTADGDWSPDRSQIVYSEPSQELPPTSEMPTTLRLFQTKVRQAQGW